jgi:DNA-binding Xre family transcriptional regulator
MMIVSRVPDLLAEKFGGKDKINMTQIMKDMDMSYTSVNAWVKNKVARFDLGVLEKWCDYLGVEPGELFTRERAG